ncbi:MAG: CoA transferase [Rhizobiales bacterium]|nr:CoA transferase [Hyphomicrobiales bacterium]NRB12763.1 CoA transferase [Hyphomicrobiales bacterium]
MTEFELKNPKLLDQILVVDFSQFLAGPLAGLKLADFGAKVIKIERPEVGDLCRNLYLSDVDVNGTNTLFHAINRNKQSYSADLKNPDDLAKVKQLIKHADVVIQNFRPNVIKRLGLDYDAVKKLNPNIIYASVTGYGNTGEWHELPGQDLLAQAKSGLMWLSGDADQPPTPMGLAVADQLAGNILVQGILAALVKRSQTGQSCLVETSLIEVLLDFQFEVLTTYMNDEQNRLPQRSSINNAHAYLSAPYGVYQTKDGFIALAMMPVDGLAKIINCEQLKNHSDPKQWFSSRDAIKQILVDHFQTQTSQYWMEIFVKNDVWASEVLDWKSLFESEGFQQLNYIQDLVLGNGQTMKTTRSPLTINGQILSSTVAAPSIGEHNQQIDEEYGLTLHHKIPQNQKGD